MSGRRLTKSRYSHASANASGTHQTPWPTSTGCRCQKLGRSPANHDEVDLFLHLDQRSQRGTVGPEAPEPVFAGLARSQRRRLPLSLYPQRVYFAPCSQRWEKRVG